MLGAFLFYYPEEIKSPNRRKKILFVLIDDANKLLDIQSGAHNLSKMTEDSLYRLPYTPDE